MKKVFLFIILFLFFSCKVDKPIVVAKYPNDQLLQRIQNNGNFFGKEEGIVLFKDKKNIQDTKNISSNIWDKTILIVSNLLPILIADEKSGLITTDWGIIKDLSENNNLYKLNIVIKNENNINISVFKKYSNGNSLKDKEIEKKIKELILN